MQGSAFDTKRKAWVVYEDNSAVTGFYQDTISTAMESIGFDSQRVSSKRMATQLFDNASKTDPVLVCTWVSFMKAYVKGFKSVILWCQGIIPEESYMRNGSMTRFRILSFFEKLSLKKAQYVICVSEAMKEHYENKYHLNLSAKCYVMPCCNSDFEEEAFTDPSRYERPSFTYVGSLAPWQCFDETLQLYKAIEDVIPNATLHVFTKETDKAAESVNTYQIRNCEIDYVKPELLSSKLRTINYGFVLREDTPVNRVATPTKLSSYTSCGVIPIFSGCLSSFARATENLRYKYEYVGNESFEGLVQFISDVPHADMVKQEYRTLFDTYYSRDYHVRHLSKELAKRFL